MAVGRIVFAFENPRPTRALEHFRGYRRLLHHRPFGGQVAIENGDAAFGMVGVVQGANDGIVQHRSLGQVFPQGLPVTVITCR